MADNGFGLCEEGELEAQMLNKSQMLIKVQMLNLALMPQFWQTPVVGCHFKRLVFRVMVLAVC